MNKVLHNSIKRLRQKEILRAREIVDNIDYRIELTGELITNIEFHFDKLEKGWAKYHVKNSCSHLVNKINEHISKATDRVAEVEASLSVIELFDDLLKTGKKSKNLIKSLRNAGFTVRRNVYTTEGLTLEFAGRKFRIDPIIF